MTEHRTPTHLLMVADVADRLNCSQSDIRGLIAAGALRTVNITAGRRSKIRIYAAGFEQFIADRTQS